MSIKKVLLLASMAIAGAVVVMPAAADDEFPWTHDHKALDKNATTKFSGTAEFSGEFGTFTCEVHIPVILEPGTTGTVETIEATTAKCAGDELLKGCVPEIDTALNLPYTMHATKTKIDVTKVAFHVIFDEKCFVPEMTMTFPSVTVDPEQPATIDNAFLHGKGTIDAFGLQFPVELGGTIAAEKAGTYGIE